MNKTIFNVLGICLMLVMIGLTTSGCSRVEAGYVGVKVISLVGIRALIPRCSVLADTGLAGTRSSISSRPSSKQ